VEWTNKIQKIRVTTGVYYLTFADNNLRFLCGCPADCVKHLMKRGIIVPVERNGVTFETGPNAILLSEIMMQNGVMSNLAEFRVLQMLYRQGMMLPDHPNNTVTKPPIRSRPRWNISIAAITGSSRSAKSWPRGSGATGRGS